MHPVPIEIIISEMIKDHDRQQVDERPQIELPLPAPPPYEDERVAKDKDENRGVVIIDIFGDDTEDSI